MAKNIFEKGRYSEADAIAEQDGDFEIEEPTRRERNQPAQQVREDLYPRREEESPYKLNKGDRDVVRTVTFKLEQARIYEALIKSDLFDGFEADPKAIDNVKIELKNFLVERLDNLMGGGMEKKKVQIDFENLSFDLPFNEEEILFLKALALTGTKGASANSNTATVTAKPVQVAETRRAGIKSIAKSPAPKINSIKKVNEVRYAEPEPEYEEEYEEEDNFPPPRREPTRRETRERPAPRKSNKEVSKMTEAEIERRNEEINREQKLKKSGIPDNAVPMPSAQTQASMVEGRANRGGDPAMAAILNTVLANKNK